MRSRPLIGKLRTGTSELLPLLAAMAGVVAALTAIYAINPRFFFSDDRQAQYFPYGLIIRDMLLHGTFPLLTARTFFGGALWLDFQNGIYNPLSLLMTLFISPAHLEISGLFYAVVTNGLLTAGGYALARSYGLKASFAALLGLTMGINLYLLYFNASDWQPGIPALAWMLFAWASMKRLLEAHTQICLRILVAATLIYMSVSTGWPHQDIALAVVMTVLFVDAARNSVRSALRLVWTGALGLAFCLPVVLPVVAALPWTARAWGFFNDGTSTPTLGGIMDFSNPAWRPLLPIFAHGGMIPFSFYFMAWFALPLLMLIDTQRVKWPAGLLVMTGVFIVLATGPAQMGPLRFPMRWLPDVHLCLLLILFILLQEAGIRVTPRRMILIFAALAVTTLYAVMNNPPDALHALGLVPEAAVFIGLLPGMLRRDAGLSVFLGTSSIIMMLLMVHLRPMPSNDLGKGDFTPPLPQRQESRIGYTLYSGISDSVLNPDDETEYLPAAMGTYYGIDVINGYSSLAHRNWQRAFGCSGSETARCAFPASALMQREPETGARYLDLVKVDEVVAEKGATSRVAEAALPRGWKRLETAHTVRFLRPAGAELPATVSWHSAALSLHGSSRLAPDGESVIVENTATKPGLVVFARLYFPGFRAFLDGKELEVRAIGGLVVGVEVPPHAAGLLRLTFLPPFFVLSIIIAAGALFCWAVATILEGRGKLRL